MGGVVAGAPRRDVVGETADVVAVAADLAEVGLYAEQCRPGAVPAVQGQLGALERELRRRPGGIVIPGQDVERRGRLALEPSADQRSEEHTSELQSLRHL